MGNVVDRPAATTLIRNAEANPRWPSLGKVKSLTHKSAMSALRSLAAEKRTRIDVRLVPQPDVLRLVINAARAPRLRPRSEEHTSELQSLRHLVCRLLLE